MIAANELRIGNWVIDKDGDFSQIDNGEYIDMDYKYFEPILLTPEILEKCKMTKRYQYFIKLFTKEGFNGKIKYLHQLQNLFFSLTGDELIFIHSTTLPVIS